MLLLFCNILSALIGSALVGALVDFWTVLFIIVDGELFLLLLLFVPLSLFSYFVDNELFFSCDIVIDNIG